MKDIKIYSNDMAYRDEMSSILTELKEFETEILTKPELLDTSLPTKIRKTIDSVQEFIDDKVMNSGVRFNLLSISRDNALSIYIVNILDQKLRDLFEQSEGFVSIENKLKRLSRELLDIIDSGLIKIAPIVLNRVIENVETISESVGNNNDAIKNNKDYFNEKLEKLKENNHDALNLAITSYNEKLRKSEKEFELKINSILESNIESFDGKVNSTLSLVDTNVSILKEDVANLDTELKKYIREEVRSFANQKNKLTEMLGSLSEFRRAKSDIKQADTEKNTADLFRLIGLLMMIIPIGGFFALFVGISTKDSNYHLFLNLPTDWTGFALRFFTILLLSTPFVYLLKESAYHRKQESTYRNRGIQLSSIGSYLDEHDKESKIKIKNDLVKYLFGPLDSNPDLRNVPDLAEQIKSVISSLESK